MNEPPPKLNYECSKCGWTRAEVGEFHAAGSWLAKIFDVQGRRFTTVTCRRCGFIDLFKGKKSTVSTIFDLLTD